MTSEKPTPKTPWQDDFLKVSLPFFIMKSEKPTPKKPWWDEFLSALVILTLPGFLVFTPWLLSSLYIARTLSSSASKTHKFYKISLIIAISSPFLFLSQQVFTFVTYSPYSDPKAASGSIMEKANTNIGNFIRLQFMYMSDYGAFAKTFNELDLDSLKTGGNTEGSYHYNLILASQDLAIISAKPLSKNMYGYNGATWKHEATKGKFVVEYIKCKSKTLGADEREASSLPLVSASNKLSCAAGWTVLYDGIYNLK